MLTLSPCCCVESSTKVRDVHIQLFSTIQIHLHLIYHHLSLLRLILNGTRYSQNWERVSCTQGPAFGVPLCFCLLVFAVERCSINCGAIALERGCANIRCKIECMSRESINLFDGARCLLKMPPAKVWGANRCCLFKWNLMKPRFPGVTHLLILHYEHLTERHYACAFHNKSEFVCVHHLKVKRCNITRKERHKLHSLCLNVNTCALYNIQIAWGHERGFLKGTWHL